MKEGIIERELVDELNKKHAVVRVGRFYVLTEDVDILGNPTFSLEGRSSFRQFYENKSFVGSDGRPHNVADVWLRSTNRREYSGITFDPGLSPDETKYNLWNGFAFKPRKGDCSKFWAHVFDNICNKNEVEYLYLRKWIASVFQKPEEVHTGVVLCGSQGTGKNSFVNPLGELFGSHFIELSGLNELLSDFNFHLKNAVLIHANEALWSNSKHGIGRLKAMITDRLCTIEAKGRDRTVLRNYKHVIISSNEHFPIHLDSDDRRFFVLRVSDAKKEDHAYFEAIKKQLDNGGYEALLYDILNEDISSYNPRIFPWSNESFKIKLMSTDSCTRYIYECLFSGFLDINSSFKWSQIISRKFIYAHYKQWCRENGEPVMTGNIFGVFLKKIFPTIGTTRLSESNGTRTYAYKLFPLSFARSEFSKYFKSSLVDIFPFKSK